MTRLIPRPEPLAGLDHSIHQATDGHWTVTVQHDGYRTSARNLDRDKAIKDAVTGRRQA